MTQLCDRYIPTTHGRCTSLNASNNLVQPSNRMYAIQWVYTAGVDRWTTIKRLALTVNPSINFPSHICKLPSANQTIEASTAYIPLCVGQANRLSAYFHISPIRAQVCFHCLSIVMSAALRVSSFANMNMKFAALLLFVSVTSATWCYQPNSNTCPGESFHGQATDSCCDELNVTDRRRGCWVEGAQHSAFTLCCIQRWGCEGIED